MGQRHSSARAAGSHEPEIESPNPRPRAEPIRRTRTLRPRRNYARWRALSLGLVYVLFGIHIAHWKLTGKTLAPLELNEVMYTLELGIVTAGFLFMAVLVLGTLIFGRFFCSWACHIMVLQELCGWILRKLRIEARPIRLRLFLLVPPLTAFYMFLWPQILRGWHDGAFPTFRFATDREGWASFVTNNFWRNLPDPYVITVTFLVCGFAMVYLLGSRTFCTYVCPYGAIFGLADRFALGRIKVNDACVQCGKCTKACTSGVRVHEETHKHGMVVNPACMKDFDCISVCPQQALSYGFARPALLRSYSSGGRFGLPYDFRLWEEAFAALSFAITVISLRGLYSRVPFLLSLAVGVMIGAGTLAMFRLCRRADFAFSVVDVRAGGRLTRAGRTFLVAFAILVGFIAHSAFVRFHEYVGLRQVASLSAMTDDRQTAAAAASALGHLVTADRWGLLTNERVERGAAFAALRADRLDDAEPFARRYLSRRPGDLRLRQALAHAFLSRNRTSEAESQLQSVVSQANPDDPSARDALIAARRTLAQLAGRRGDHASAAVELRALLALDPSDSLAHAELGGVLAELGQWDDAVETLREALRLDPEVPDAAYNLATLLAHMRRFAEAVPLYETAARRTPGDADVRNNYGFALMQVGRTGDAEQQLRDALAKNASHAGAHFNLGLLLASKSEMQEAEMHLRTAARLDPRFARALESASSP